MSFKKIDKEFCITDNSVNCYGYRLLTEGFQIESFNPPIGYLMHDRDKGVAVRWSDFRVDGDKVFAKPTVNALQFPNLASEIEAGFYNAASVGHIIALEWTDDAAQKLSGQTGITVTKWFCRECSIVDVPGNFNAIAELYDKDEKSLKNLISKPTHTAETDVENIPEKYRKTAVELFVSGDLQYVKEHYPQYFAKITSNSRPLPGYGTKSSEARTDIFEKATSTGLQANDKETPIPEKYMGKSYADLWLSGDLDYLKRMHPLYVKQLKEEYQKDMDKQKNRGTVNESKTDDKKRTPSDTSLPEQYRNKTRQELFFNGGLDYLKAHYPTVFKELIAN